MKNYLLIIGFLLVAAFTATAQTGGNKIIGVWCNETNTVHIDNPPKGLTASCEIEMPDSNTLKVKASKGLFSTVKTWKRIK